MSKLLSIMVSLLIAVNAVIGGHALLILCQHGEADSHVLWAGDHEGCVDVGSQCREGNTAAHGAHCVTCDDIVLRAPGFAPVRADEVPSLEVAAPALHSIFGRDRPTSTRDVAGFEPPGRIAGATTFAEMPAGIERTTVLRL